MKMGLQGLSDGELLAFGLITLATLVAVAGACLLVYTFSAKTRKVERGVRAVKLSAKIIAATVAIGFTVNYALDIRLRALAHECERKNSDDGQYLAELCLLRDNGHDADYVGRVYDARNGELLGERTFDTAETDLLWFHGQVSFTRGGNDSDGIELPPSLLDRVRAKLP